MVGEEGRFLDNDLYGATRQGILAISSVFYDGQHQLMFFEVSHS